MGDGGKHVSRVFSLSSTTRATACRKVGMGTSCTIVDGRCSKGQALFLKGNALLITPKVEVRTSAITGMLLRGGRKG